METSSFIDLLDQSQVKCNRSFPVKFENMTFLRFFENFKFFIENLFDDIPMPLAWPVSSTSLPGGNQIDGLPPVSSVRALWFNDRVKTLVPPLLKTGFKFARGQMTPPLPARPFCDFLSTRLSTQHHSPYSLTAASMHYTQFEYHKTKDMPSVVYQQSKPIKVAGLPSKKRICHASKPENHNPKSWKTHQHQNHRHRRYHQQKIENTFGLCLKRKYSIGDRKQNRGSKRNSSAEAFRPKSVPIASGIFG